MCKKAGIICLICLMLVLLASCDDPQPALQAQRAQYGTILASLLTPEDSEIITSVEDLLILDSTQPFPDLIHFYITMLFELSVEETGLNDRREGIWIYSGIYDRNKPITIEMRDNGESIRVYIIY